jgi:uroporphyrinogen-III synthase
LAGWYVISLRPLGQHGKLRRLAARRQAQVFAISTLRLLALDALPALRRAMAAPVVIAASPAAVRFSQAQQPLRRRPGQDWFALGEGTAAALRRAGLAQVGLPDSATSEGLLAHPRLRAVRGQAVGLLTAPGGRDLIAPTLTKRGAEVRRADVYQRVPLRPAPARLRALAALPRRSALLVSSAEALAVLWSTLDRAGQQALCHRLAVASSERLCTHLRALGFTRIVRAESAHPDAQLAALAAHVGTRGFR